MDPSCAELISVHVSPPSVDRYTRPAAVASTRSGSSELTATRANPRSGICGRMEAHVAPPSRLRKIPDVELVRYIVEGRDRASSTSETVTSGGSPRLERRHVLPWSSLLNNP